MAVAGLLLIGALVRGPVRMGAFFFDFHFMFVGSLLAILGTQVALLGLFARAGIAGVPRWFTLERGLVAGGALLGGGIAANLVILIRWIASGFGPLNAVRPAVVALTLMAVGAQLLFSSFYLDLVRAEAPSDDERV